MRLVERGRLRLNGDNTAQTGPQVRLSLTNSRPFAAVVRCRGGRRGHDGEAGGEGKQSVWRRVVRRHRSSDHCGDTTWLRPATGSPRSLLRVVMDRSESLRVGVGQGRSSSELGGAEKHHLEQLLRLLLRPPAPPAALESPGILKSHRIRTHQPTQKNFGDSIAATRSTTRSTGMQHHREYQYRDSGTRRSTQNFSEEEEKISTTRLRRLDRRLDCPAGKTIGNINTGTADSPVNSEFFRRLKKKIRRLDGDDSTDDSIGRHAKL